MGCERNRRGSPARREICILRHAYVIVAFMYVTLSAIPNATLGESLDKLAKFHVTDTRVYDLRASQ